jgi:hypothetical protein
MKTVFLFLLLPIIGLTQNSISEIIEFEKGKESEIYYAAKKWFYDAFKDGDAVISFEDVESMRIEGKANTGKFITNGIGHTTDNGRFNFDISFAVREGRAKIELSNIIYEAGEVIPFKSGANYFEDYPANWAQKFGRKYNEKRWIAMKKQAAKRFDTAIERLKNSINIGIEKTEKDW